MKPRLEPRAPRLAAQSIFAYQRREAAFPFAWHYHPECELTLIETGEGTRCVGDAVEPYRPGDLVLLGGGLPHTWSSERPTRRAGAHRAVVVQFSATLFTEQPSPEFAAVRGLLARAARGLRLRAPGELVEALRALPTLSGLAAWCALAHLLDAFARVPCEPLASPSYTPSPGHGARRRHERALAYIAERLTEGPLYLHEVARAVHLTPSAFSRFFLRHEGMSFVDYVNTRRIEQAARLLAETDRTVADIAFACGFGNLANFNRRFRVQRGRTPSDHRQLSRA